MPDGQGSSTPWCFYGLNYTTTPPPFPPPAHAGSPFTSAQVSTMFSYFLANLNIQGLGGVVASPDTTTPGGSYYYHWERDGALSMHALQIVSNFTFFNPYMQSYVQWVLKVQNEADPNGIDVRTEPKYNLPNGDVFTGGWCRPQTDGPGLRAIALIDYANSLMKNGQSNYIKQYLWTSNPNVYNGGAIKHDLDWIVSNWQQNGCDLWEEVQSTDFFWNRFTMKHSLYLGSQLAAKLGDSATAQSYNNVANAINQTLIKHWNGEYIYESTNRPEDSAVILAFNNGYSNDGFLGPTDPRVTATINTLNFVFYFAYPINLQDSANGVPGIMYGRYPGDTYAGGNPWILSTASLAQLFYRGAGGIITGNAIPAKESHKDWEDIFSLVLNQTHPAHVLKTYTPLEFARLVTSAGDAVLDRLYVHVQAGNFHLAEQIDKNTGEEVSATDLTWSYATVLKAMHYRNVASASTLKMAPELSADAFYEQVAW